MTTAEMQRLAMRIPELAKAHNLKPDGWTWNYAATLYMGKAEDLRAFAQDLHLRGARFEWTSNETIAVD